MFVLDKLEAHGPCVYRGAGPKSGFKQGPGRDGITGSTIMPKAQVSGFKDSEPGLESTA